MDARDWTDASVRAYLQERYGLDADRLNTSWLERLLTALRKTDAAASAIESAIVSAATVHESMFLRHANHFEWLSEQWLPGLIAQRQVAGEPYTVRVLSAACASGEEPYSLAATILPLLPAEWLLHIDAIDACQASLDAAAANRYSLWSLRGVPESARQSWLAVDDHTVTVSDAVRRPVRFARHNLLDALPSDWHFDLVVCRNVLIYFHPDAVSRTYGNLAAVLRPHGVILPGPSDPPPPASLGMSSVLHGTVWIHQRQGVAALAAGPGATAAPLQGRVRVGHTADRADTARASAKASATAAASRPQPASPQTATSPPRARASRSGSASADHALTAHGSSPDRERSLPWSSAAQPADDAHAQYALARQMVLQGDPTLGLQLLQQQLRDYPTHVPSLVLAALTAIDTRAADEALVRARAAAFLEPDAAFIAYLSGEALRMNNQAAQAEKRFEWAGKLLTKLNDSSTLPYSEDLTVRQLKAMLEARTRGLRG